MHIIINQFSSAIKRKIADVNLLVWLMKHFREPLFPHIIINQFSSAIKRKIDGMKLVVYSKTKYGVNGIYIKL